MTVRRLWNTFLQEAITLTCFYWIKLTQKIWGEGPRKEYFNGALVLPVRAHSQIEWSALYTLAGVYTDSVLRRMCYGSMCPKSIYRD